MNTKWNFIETKNDLPKERGCIWTVCQGRVGIYNDFDPSDDMCIRYCLENFSYWQKVIKPEFIPFSRSNEAER